MLGLIMCVCLCVCVCVTGEYLKSVWSTLPEEEQSGCVLSSERKRLVASFFLSSSPLHGDSRVMERKVCEYKNSTHTHTHTHNPHKYRKCFASAKADETVDDTMG